MTPSRVGAWSSLDHLVGAHQQRCRSFDADGFRGFRINQRDKLDRLLDRQVRRFSASENLVDENRPMATHFDKINTIGQKSAGPRELWEATPGEPIFQSKIRSSLGIVDEHRV